jgi:hypothetical protein
VYEDAFYQVGKKKINENEFRESNLPFQKYQFLACSVDDFR